MADEGQNHSFQFDGINVNIRVSIEYGMPGALRWNCFKTQRKKL